jgi:SAM-dependent MidA family methyltransferase
MKMLPMPSLIAMQHSDLLMHLIYDEINKAGGYISFSRFMELALYAPGLGYYSAGSYKFGKIGDFMTAPEISPLFAKSIAKQCKQVLQDLECGDILEVGAGSGKLASDLLQELERLQCLPEHYYILEISAELRERQNMLLDTECPHLLSRVQWLDHPPKTPFTGIILANEVLDAMPVHCFQIDKDSIKERCVTVADHDLEWISVPPTTPELTKRVEAIQKECPMSDQYHSEINLMLPHWIQTMANVLQEGMMLLFDYGYGRREYYHPDRNGGTLMCHYQHHRHTDSFILVGLQDITAHVDFTTVAESAVSAGLALAGYATQSSFLLACGIIEAASQQVLSPLEQFQQNHAIKLLTLPSQMGELVKVIGLTRGIHTPLLGFSLHDRRHDL